jgi:CMP/dCMP kinase
MTRARPVIAIDGPVGAGKSTVARELARMLGFTYVNTGAMYRAVAVAMRQADVSFQDSALDHKVAAVLEKIRIGFDGERVMLNGRDVSASIVEPEIGDLASQFSTLASVRARMRTLQRAAGERGGVVMEGRDIGTAVFPDAEFKFYLEADARVRAQRRYKELAAKGVQADCAQVMRGLAERDERDRGRALAPLRRAPDAVVIDTTRLSIAEVVDRLKTRIEGRL